MYSRSAEFTGDARSEVEFATNVFVALQRALHSGVLAGFTCGMVVVGYSVCLRRYKKVLGGGRDGENSYVEVANDALLEKFRRHTNNDCLFLTSDTCWHIAKQKDYEDDKCHPTALLLEKLDPKCLLEKSKGKLYLPSAVSMDMKAKASVSDSKRAPKINVTYMLVLVRVLLRAPLLFLVYGSCITPLMLPVA